MHKYAFSVTKLHFVVNFLLLTRLTQVDVNIVLNIPDPLHYNLYKK